MDVPLYEMELLNSGGCGAVLEDQGSVECLSNGNWAGVLDNDLVGMLVDKIVSVEAVDGLDHELRLIIKEFVEDDPQRQKACFILGITALKAFLQANWTGPDVELGSLGRLSGFLGLQDLVNSSLSCLHTNGEVVYHLLRYPFLLVLARTILVDARESLSFVHTTGLWAVKCLAAHLSVLEKSTTSILSDMNNVFDDVCGGSLLEHLPRNLVAEFYLDCSHIFLQLYDYQKTQVCTDKAGQCLGIEIALSSSLGKRTKYQQKALPQLKLEVAVAEEREPVKSTGEATKDLPTDLVLDEENLLPNIVFLDSVAVSKVQLSKIDQALVITKCIQVQKLRPKDNLTPEEVMPYIDSVLQSPQAWGVQYKALFLRCLIELNQSRKAERAMSQLEDLTKTISKPMPVVSERLAYLHSVDLQPIWETQRALGQFFFGLGCNDSALEIFLKLQLWDDVITCYQRLGRHGKAEEVIREQLKMKQTPLLYCLLGDATMDKQYYEIAWDLSNEKNARSQRSLGLWYLRRQELQASIPHFQKSLELNALQPSIWFSYGCAALASGKLDLAIKGFQQCVGIDPDNSQAWNNLSSAFIRTGQLLKAHKALQEATRLSYENWKIWENFLLVTADIGSFDEAITCCHRLLDLGRKSIDVEALQVLVRACLDDLPDCAGNAAGRLLQKLFTLFGHITSQITDNPAIWDLYAKLALSKGTHEDSEKALHYLYKSHRCYHQNSEWEKSLERLPEVMRVTRKLHEVTKQVAAYSENTARAVHFLSSTKLSFTNLLLRFQKSFVDSSGNLMEEVKLNASELQSFIDDLQSAIVEAS